MNETHAKIVRMLLKGHTPAKLAEMFSVTPQRICQIGREHGVKLKKAHPESIVTPEEVEARIAEVWRERLAGKLFEAMDDWEARP